LAALIVAGGVLAAVAQGPAEAAHRGGGGLGFGSGFRGGSARIGFGSTRSSFGFGHRSAFSSRPAFSTRPGSRGGHFGISIGDSRFRFHFGTTRHHGFTRHFGGRTHFVPTSILYPPVFGGLYPYSTGVYLRYYPSYSSLYYPTVPRTVYLYPPPVVRYYEDPSTAPREGERPREMERVTPGRTPHPYDDPVAPTPEKGSLDEALTRIRTAWLREDVALLAEHLPAQGDITLYHDGEPRRELSATEFRRLTQEAVRETRTISFRYTEVKRPADDEATATALHTYVGEGLDDRDATTVTLRYDLVRRENVWTLRAVHVLAEGATR
jgi:hypothetical protein